jgi:hypothetical protein
MNPHIASLDPLEQGTQTQYSGNDANADGWKNIWQCAFVVVGRNGPGIGWQTICCVGCRGVRVVGSYPSMSVNWGFCKMLGCNVN